MAFVFMEKEVWIENNYKGKDADSTPGTPFTEVL